MTERDSLVWHVYLPRIGPGQRYGYRDPRPVRARARPTLRPVEAADGPVREGPRGRDRLGAGLLLLRLRRPREAQPGGLGAAHDEVGRGQPVLRLAGRPASAPALPRDGHLRGPRQGDDDAASADPRGDPRHVRRDGAPGDDRAPDLARRHRGRADARAPVRQRLDPGRQAGSTTTGATTRSASSHRTTPTARRASAASRCWSSRRWCASCTAPTSR